MIRINQDKYKEIITKIIKIALYKLNGGKENIDLEINIIDEEEIKELNFKTRNINEPTDVLSFQNIENIKLPINASDYPYDINYEDESIIIGEIYICESVAEKQAKEYGHSIEREIGFLACHGLLHLLGYDHQNQIDNAKMQKITEEILKEAELTREKDIFKSGFIAVMGKPNAGKSTLINTIVGEKVSIVSWKPQTTRNKILGIYNEKDYQLIFIDTPGLHKPKNALGEFMMKEAGSALADIDCVVYLIDSEKGYDEKDKINIVGYLNAGLNVIAAVNKVDHVTKEKVFEILSELKKLQKLKAVVPLSALRNRNIEPLIMEIKKLLTDSVKYFDDEQYTNKDMRFMASEIIREKTLRLLDQEVPYGIGVEIIEYFLRENTEIIDISADIVCEKNAHKPIILGKKGEMIKKIGTYARQDLENITGKKVFLKLFVKVRDDWRGNENIMRDLGYQ